jgi:alkanesulfonate monooxygenase SsuD/methylene tetrahydromethanopterin reductase-like flavin-dependent oxidoreductase (luciferase family)
MHYGVIAPNFGDYSDPNLLVEMAREIEEAGWEGFFLWDQMAINEPAPIADPWVALAAIAANTRLIKLGPFVTPISRRRPWKLARETVTLDYLSGGRLVLGVGLGAFDYEEFEALGEEHAPKIRAARLDEGLQVLAGLWSGEPFSFEGEHFHVKEAQFLPTPVQQPRIPVWVAGIWPNKAPFRRAARWDGVIPGWDVWGDKKQMPDDFRAMVSFINEERERASVTGPFDVVLAGKSSGDRPGEDEAAIRPYIEAGVTWWLEDLNPWRGTLQQMRERVRKGPPRVS